MYLTRFFTLLEQIVNFLWSIERQLLIANAIGMARLSNSPRIYGTDSVCADLRKDLDRIEKQTGKPPYATPC